MSKKSIIAILSAVVLMVVASIAMVFTIGPKTSADSEEIETVPVEYLRINNGILGRTISNFYLSCDAFTEEGKNWIKEHGKYRVKIPSTVTYIGSFAFNDCSNLTSVEIPSSVTSISKFAFAGCRGLTSITIPEGVTSIGDSAFASCSGLTSITIPEGVTSIGSSAFNGCSSLTSVNIPEGVTSIGDSAFYNCSGLKSITIPEGVTSIGEYAFYYCSGLTSITIPNSVTSIGNVAFMGCSGLTSITIPEGVTSIGGGAFGYCSGLTSITIPEGVTSMGESVFRDCSGLTSITIPESVTSISDKAFYGCSGLTSITIPASVTSIGNSAFRDCSGLNEIIVRNPALMTNTNLQSYASKLHYGAEQNTVTFNTMGGTSVPNQVIDFGEFASEPTVEKAGYSFIGWYSDKQCTKPFTFDTPIKYDITVYAKWQINQYTVTFDSNEGSTVTSQTVDYGTVINSPVTTRTGYTFKGWLNNGVAYDFSHPITEDMNLIADWDINVYTVTFDACNGNALVEQPVTYNEKVIRPTDPTRASCNFKGWYQGLQDSEPFDFNTLITKNITLYAKWENVYMVTFNVDGGTTIPNQEIENGQTATRPTDPIKVGHTFAGWYTNANLTNEFNFNTPITGSMTLYAKWQVNQYTVEFWWQNGTHTESQTVDYGTPVQRPTDPTKEGYTFVGWFTDDLYQHPYDFNAPVTEDFGLFAQWTINQYTVTFDSKQGSSVLPQTVNWKTKISRPSDPVREGYDFLGWYLNNEEYNFDEFVTDNMTLTAKWKSNNPDIPDEPETPDESETPIEENTEVSNKNNSALIWGIAGTAAGILIISGIVFGTVISKRRRK